MRLRNAVTRPVKHKGNEDNKSENQKMIDLREDILNVPFHVFGQHQNVQRIFVTPDDKKLVQATIVRFDQKGNGKQ